MADARSKKVLSALADLASRTNYVADKVNQLREPLGTGDIIEVPNIGSLTVTANGATQTTPQSVTTSILSCQASLHPAIFAELPAADQAQLLDGNWAAQLASQALIQLRNSIDTTLCNYLAASLAYDSAAAYHDNVASDSLAIADFANAIGALLAQGGAAMDNLAVFLHPFAYASMVSISGWQPNGAAAEAGKLGIPLAGSVMGVPVFITASVPRRRTVASTAWAIVDAANTHTITVAVGHGIVPGIRVTFDTVTAAGDIPTTATVTSVTATTVVTANTGVDANATEAGTITIEGCENLVFDRSQVHVGMQKMPGARIVPFYDKTSDALQVSSLWGRVGRAGYARVLMSPPSSA